MELQPTPELESRPRAARLAVLRPLRIRDFALLWTGATVSLLGDGIFVVAIAWQVYEISNSPSALSLVGLAWTLPLAVFLLAGGIVSDRFDRRRVMIAADILRAAAVGAIAVLSLTGHLRLWHLIALAVVYGSGEAFFGPAFSAIVPQIVPRRLLLEANSLDQFIRPFAFRLVGPAVGGWLVAAFGSGTAFAIDGVTFLASAVAVALMAPRPLPREGMGASVVAEIREGLRFVRAHTWLWGTLLAAAISLLAFWGPVEVLLPYRIRNELGGGADDFGFVLAVGGVGSIVAALVLGQRGMPRRHITVMYSTWVAGGFLLVGFGLATALWHAMAVSFLQGGLFTAGLVIWGTLMHALVPTRLLGRVTSLDWFVSTSLVPVSFALTGPVAAGIGAEATLIGAGLVAGAVTLACFFLPGMRDTERSGVLRGALADPVVPE
ncbi:MAG TPA: MFS transporter [Gaiellaceae bacterium]|nr:MFS transporter [Gaiellaceae bacterium]